MVLITLFCKNGTTYYSSNLYSESNTTNVSNLNSNPEIIFSMDSGNNFINLNSTSAIEKIVLLDANGKLVFEKNLCSLSTYSLNTEKLLSGVYILSVSSGNNTRQWRFVQYQ